jgi:hypothetical protein
LKNWALLLWFLCLGASYLSAGPGPEEQLLRLEGEFITYSYDFNQIFGRAVLFDWEGYRVSCIRLKIDIPSRSFYAYGRVRLVRDEDEITGDELVFDPAGGRGTLVVYGEQIEKRPVGSPGAEPSPLPLPELEELTLSRIQSSLLYCTCREIEITESYEVVGFGVTFYVEGLPSLSFTRFKLSDGIRSDPNGFSLDKVWYTKSQGLIGNASYRYQAEDLINSTTSLHYEERSLLKDFQGASRQVNLMHATSLVFNPTTTLGFNGNYNSSRLWNTNFWVNKKWSEVVSTNFDFAVNKPVNFAGEAWFGGQAMVNAGRIGELSLGGRSDLQRQFIGNLAYGVSVFRNLNVLLNSSYTRVQVSGSDEYSEILAGTLSLVHASRVFNFAADYYLNYDLLGSDRLSQPQLRLGINPLTFYEGLLSFSLNNILIYNLSETSSVREQTYSNNTVFSLGTKSIDFPYGLSLDFSLSAEQFIEKKGRHFTSGGVVLNLRKRLFQGVVLETFYSTQSRRRTQNWLIEGTTSQDLSLILRASPKSWLDGWVSVSYDPKARRWQQSFADLSVALFRSWRFHSLLNYDFLLNKLSNVDLYLIRDAGRFQLRFVWRSLSKQFLVELIPL